MSAANHGKAGAAFVGVPYAGAASESTADIGGWTTPTPKTRDTSTYALMHISQPGSRIYYVSSSAGTDSNSTSVADVYFWDGANIIDSSGSTTGAGGVAYGTNPFNPTGPIKPFKTWCKVWWKSGGAEYTATPSTVVVGSGIPNSGGRNTFSDWVLFAVGDTWDISADLAAYGSSQQANSSLAMPGSADASYPQVAGYYGDIASTARPRFTKPQTVGFCTRNYSASATTWRNVNHLSLHFDGHTRTTSDAYHNGIGIGNHTAASTGILYEDVWLDGCALGISAPNGGLAGPFLNGQITFRRMITTECFGASTGVGGTFTQPDVDYKWIYEDSIALRNGYAADPAITWPGTKNIFSRNFYSSGHMDCMNSYFRNNISCEGASGDQFRHGVQLLGNYFLTDYVLMGGNGGYDRPDSGGRIWANILEAERDTVCQALTIDSSMKRVEVSHNIFTHAGQFTSCNAPVYLAQTHYFGAYGYKLKDTIKENEFAHNIIYMPASSLQIEHQARKSYQGDNWIAATGGAATVNGTTQEATGVLSNYKGIVANEAAMLALPGLSVGDFVSREDLGVSNTNQAFIFQVASLPTSVIGNWTLVAYGTAGYGDVMRGPSSPWLAQPWHANAFRSNVWVIPSAFAVGYGTGIRYLDNAYATVSSEVADTSVTNNRPYTTISAAIAAEGWTDPYRTLKKYLQARGVTVTSTNGVTELLAIAKGMRRFTWRQDMQAKRVVNYIRDGFGQLALP